MSSLHDLWFLSQEYRFDRYAAPDGADRQTCFDPLGSSGLFNGDPPSDFIFSGVKTPEGFWISSGFNSGDPLHLRHISANGLTTLASFSIAGQNATGYLNAMARRANGNLLLVLNAGPLVSEYTPTGVFVATYSMPGDVVVIALAANNTTLYYGVSGDSVLHAWNLATDMALPDWGDFGQSWLNAGLGGLSLQALADGRMLITATILDEFSIPTWQGAQLWAANALSIEHDYAIPFDVGYDNITAILDTAVDRVYVGAGSPATPDYGASLFSFILSTEAQEWTVDTFTPLPWEGDVAGNFGGLLLFGATDATGLVTDITHECGTNVLVLTGEGFSTDDPDVTVTLNGVELDDFTISDESSTSITVTLDTPFQAGTYCASVDDVAPALCVALSCAGPVPPDGTHFEIRRVRRVPHVSNDGNRIFHQRLELQMQPGIGKTTGQGSEPVVFLRTSNDGGNTWSTPRTASPGPQGSYFSRVYWTQLGMSRDRVYEVSFSDPVVGWVIVQAWISIEQGTN